MIFLHTAHFSTSTFHDQYFSAPVHFTTSTFQHQYISGPVHFSTITLRHKFYYKQLILKNIYHSLSVISSVNMELEIPDECPVCKKVSKNLLLHVRKSEKCSSVIDSELLKNWREAAHKMKSRKAQSNTSHLYRSNIKENKIVQAIRQCRGLSKTHTKIFRCLTTFLDGGFWRYSSKTHFFLTF